MHPAEEYAARLERLKAQENLLDERFRSIGNWRLITGLATAVLAWFVFARHSVPLWTLLIPVFVFAGLVAWHQRVIRRRAQVSRAAAFYKEGLARVQDKWAGSGSTGDRFRNPAHVYSEDLDLFGRGGLFELLSRARTAAGQDVLAAWLLAPALVDEAVQRQQAVQELSGNLQLREDLAILAEDLKTEIDVNSLGAWGASAPVQFPDVLRFLAPLLAVSGIAAVIAFFGQRIPISALLGVLLCDALIIFPLRSRVRAVLSQIESTGREIKIFSNIIRRLEQEQFSSPLLKKMRRDLDVAGEPASRRIYQLGRLVDWLDSSDHTVVRILRPIVLWQEQLAMAFERWRSPSGKHVGAWVNAVAQFEALSSIASLYYEKPDWKMPELLADMEARFDAEAMKHPLLPSAECVPNDLRLDSQQRMLIVSGSNMSGKSTLLRSTGLNTVLAWAGAPVAANRLRLSRLQTGASIRVNDSLQDHRSRFFAEIMRLRQIMDVADTGQAVLFLLDEVLSGTNSHDRRVGATAIVQGLLRTDAIGLITTHDLALASIEGDVNTRIVNVHFEERMDGTQMLFDYKLKPGIVTRSNALELMRAVGLNV